MNLQDSNVEIYGIRSTGLKKKELLALIDFLSKKLSFSLESLSVTFVSDKKMIQVNTSYLGHNYPTDIITFDYSEEINKIDGDILISPVVAKENAEKYKNSFEEEIYRLIIHGILHLLGYSDTDSHEKRIMKKWENSLLKEFIKTKHS